MKIMFVCTGNTCRSAMAHHMLEKMIKEKDNVEVYSCGIYADSGEPATYSAIDVMKEYGVDSAAAGNMINDLKFVNEITVWIFLSEDIKSILIRANIRSVGPYVNDTAAKYGGGGHKYASGAKLKDWETADKLINELDDLTKKYKQVNK